jgi:DNA polymerase III delta prime subunit
MNTHSMWSEKHQPKSLDECILDAFPQHVSSYLRHTQTLPRIPNILLYGIAGTGKSTIAKVICDLENYEVRRVDGSLLNKQHIPELKTFASTSTLFQKPKIIFVDEADGISPPAQLALRSLIEPELAVSWLFTCNYRKKLIEPITSRFIQIECALPANGGRERHISAIVTRCQQILSREGIPDTKASEIHQIASAKYPDIRATINELQLRYGFLARAA